MCFPWDGPLEERIDFLSGVLFVCRSVLPPKVMIERPECLDQVVRQFSSAFRKRQHLESRDCVKALSVGATAGTDGVVSEQDFGGFRSFLWCIQQQSQVRQMGRGLWVCLHRVDVPVGCDFSDFRNRAGVDHGTSLLSHLIQQSPQG